ncbi:MAG: HAD family phosphatase [Anaerolineales bacterium]|nr:HAD family phosphatase [Anaerolineales bacterium]
MIKTVIFDLGGVLIRTEDRGPRQDLADKYGMSYQELSELVYGTESADLATRGKISAEDHHQEILKSLNLPPDSISAFEDEFWGGDLLDEKLVEFISNLRGEYRTALLSNAWDNLRQLLKELWKIDHIFDHLFISAELGLAKPEPEIYQVAIETLKQDPSELIFIDDFIENVEAAREVGLNAIHFRNREQALADLAEHLDLEL